MKMILPVIILALLISCGENGNTGSKTAANADTAKTAAQKLPPKPAFFLPVPDGWTVEEFPIPIEFAPQIRYRGLEELRFSPGWGDVASEQHWTYFFLWWLNDNPTPDAASLQQNLTDYYNGLVGRNITERKIPAEKLVPTKVTITEVTQPATGDLHTFTGTIHMLNYLKQVPVTLNCKIHERKCANNRTALMFEISPQGPSHQVWRTMESIVSGFTCE